MRLLLLLGFVFAGSGINAYVAEITDILRHTEKMNQYVTECIDEGGYEIAVKDVTTVFSNEESKDKECMGKVSRCIFHKAGILDPDGKLNKDASMAILTLIGVKKKDADELLQKCTSIAGFDAKDMAYAIFKCFDDGVRS